MPADDWRPHEMRIDCWCHPTDDDDAPGIYVHHSMDGREEYQTGERLMS